MSPGHAAAQVGAEGFPRVSGDEPLTEDLVLDTLQFSPREWG